jgi:hypothetical protein
MNILKQKTLKLLLAIVLVGSASLSANASFYDEESKLYFNITGDNTCSVTSAPTTATYSDLIQIPAIVTYEGDDYLVTAIGESAFWNCSSLTSVFIPDTIITIGNYAFASCTGLNNILTMEEIEGTEEWELLSKIPNSVTSIGDGAFSRCTSLAYIILSENLESIGDNAFSGCTALVGTKTKEFTGEEQKVLVIPNSVRYIGIGAFFNCSALENLWLGAGVKTIKNQAFYNCTSLETVSPTSLIAPDLTENAFSDATYTDAQLLLPLKTTDANYDAMLKSYKSTDNNWIKFTKDITTGVGEVSTDDVTVQGNGMRIEVVGNEGTISIYNMSGVEVYNGVESSIEMSTPGVYVVTVNGKSYKVAVK